ncbi:hypothetical protein SCOCK_370044 [Actinacidiphila cocklensis]|uniref:Uncharacterized protein n=1 Tax=Actinacidiphila cocklensis TaxID=887465 RepID=A0A9W4DTR6_9ACTN|nr:hypothetical protein SCOCK_370044 [Actinacidiphila cocklensis]
MSRATRRPRRTAAGAEHTGDRHGTLAARTPALGRSDRRRHGHRSCRRPCRDGGARAAR